MDHVERLREWIRNERKRGLLDIKIFPGSQWPPSLQDASRSMLEALTATDFVDITDEVL